MARVLSIGTFGSALAAISATAGLALVVAWLVASVFHDYGWTWIGAQGAAGAACAGRPTFGDRQCQPGESLTERRHLRGTPAVQGTDLQTGCSLSLARGNLRSRRRGRSAL